VAITFTLAHPRNSDVLIKRGLRDGQQLPWADVWPSHVLADHIVRQGQWTERPRAPGAQRPVACALAAAGYVVTATDYYADALEFTRNNAWRNTGRRITTHGELAAAARDLGRFDVVVASDVLYEHTHGELVSDALLATLRDDGYA
jgi:predicted nicotinamide N-methyase